MKIIRKNLKYCCFLLIPLIILVLSINFIKPNNNEKIKGKIHIWVNNNTYEYIVKCSSEFMKLNNKVSIQVDKISDYKILSDNFNNNLNEVQIFECNNDVFLNNKLDKFEYYNIKDDIFESYKNNFSDNTIKNYCNNYKYAALPLTTRPLALYIKSDLLYQYGYSSDDFNTWNDVIKIGTDIYSKSNGKIKLLNGIGQDYKDLYNLILMQCMDKNKDKTEIKNSAIQIMNELKRNNIIAVNNQKYIAKVSSVNASKDIINEKNIKWSLSTVPSLSFGTNKFYTYDDTELYILNNKNKSLTNKFISYILANEESSIEYMQQGDFFLSYLYTYKNKKIEKNLENIEGQSPLIVLSNIGEKSQYIDEYNKYIEIKKELSI